MTNIPMLAYSIVFSYHKICIFINILLKSVSKCTDYNESYPHQVMACWNIKPPDSKVHGANMGPSWGWQDPGVPHIGPMNFAILAFI